MANRHNCAISGCTKLAHFGLRIRVWPELMPVEDRTPDAAATLVPEQVVCREHGPGLRKEFVPFTDEQKTQLCLTFAAANKERPGVEGAQVELVPAYVALQFFRTLN